MLRELAQTFLDAAKPGGKSAAAHVILRDPTSSMLELYAAARHLLSEDFVTWEPETLWLALLDLSPSNRDKFMAAIAVTTQPSFFVDFRVFGHTCEVAANDTPNLGNVPRPSPEAMAWAVIEATCLYCLESEDDPEFSYDVEAFVAASLATAGFSVTTEYLKFAASDLNKLCSAEGKEVAKAFEAKKKDSTPAPSAVADAVEVQELRESELELYIKTRVEQACKGLRTLL